MTYYQMLANAIVQQAADDYFQLMAGIAPVEVIRSASTQEIERFFHSEWFEALTELDPDYLLKKLREKARKMVLKYSVSKQKNSSQYYVHFVDDPHKPIPKSFGTKKEALKLAAKLNGLELRPYMQLRRRDGVDKRRAGDGVSERDVY